MLGEIRTPADVGEAVRRTRLRHGQSQVELAAALGVSQRYLSEVERGTPKRFDERYIQILNKLGVRLRYDIDV